ncbi:hypothetical protein MPC1_14510001 [Methylocella tundrae]|nr:hypothetical protein MPC1_14510001 [Methylocella tundrae]
MIGLASRENAEIQERRLGAINLGVADRAWISSRRFGRTILKFLNEGADGMTHWTSGCEMPP